MTIERALMLGRQSVAANGNLYTVSSNTLVKTSLSGTTTDNYAKYSSDQIYDLVSDSSGNLYNAVSNTNIVKIASNGTVTYFCDIGAHLSTYNILASNRPEIIISSGLIYFAVLTMDATTGASGLFVGKISSNSTITTCAVISNVNVYFIRQVIADNSGNVFVSFFAETDFIIKITAGGVVTNPFVTLSYDILDYRGMVPDTSGNIYILNGKYLTKVTPSGAMTSAWVDLSSYSTMLGNLSIDSNDNIYISTRLSANDKWSIAKITSSGSLNLNWGDLSDSYFDSAYLIYTHIDFNNNIFASIFLGGSTNNTHLTKFTSAGAKTLYWAEYSSQNDQNPKITHDSNGNLYVADKSIDSHIVSKITSAGLKSFILQSPITPVDMVSDTSGNIYVASRQAVVTKTTSSGGITSRYATTNNRPKFLLIDSSNTLYVVGPPNYSSSYMFSISKISSSGVVTNGWAEFGDSATLQIGSELVGAEISGGKIYAYVRTYDESFNTIGKLITVSLSTQAINYLVTLTNTSLDVIGNGDIVFDSAGNLYVIGQLSSNQFSIKKISTSGSVNDTWATLPSGAYPYSLAIDLLNNVYVVGYAGGSNNGHIHKINSSGSVSNIITINQSGMIYTNYVSLISVDSNNYLYVVLSPWLDSNYYIAKISPSGSMAVNWANIGQHGAPIKLVIREQ